MNKIKIIILAVIVLFLYSCNNKQDIQLEGINFKTSEYYDSFLFVSADNKPTSKSIEFEFNDWAKSNNSFVEINFIDNNNKIIGTKQSKIKVFANGKLCENGSIKLKPNTNNVLDIKLQFEPNADEKSYMGYIVVNSNKIDRINNIENISSDTKIFEWSAKFNIVMNPLKKLLIWFLVIVVSFLLLWFIILRNLFFKKIQKGKIIINSPYSNIIKVTGCRKVIFSTKAKKQKTLHKIFAGKILYEVNLLWEHPIEFTPKDKRSLRIKTGINYSITPFTNQVTRGKSYEIKKNKELIKISFL